MKQYEETESGSYVIDGMSIPASDGNRHYRQMQVEVEAGEAEIIPYTEPEPTAQDRIAVLETSVTPRRMREAALTTAGKNWLQNIDDQIKALR